MIYTVTLNPALDYVMKLNQLLPGGMNRAEKTQLLPGGKGINVSLMLHNLGQSSVALGFLAGFTGQEIKKRLETKGILTDFILLREGSSRINVKVKAEQETELNADGPPIREEEMAMLLEKLDRLKAGDYLVLAGSIPGTLPENLYEEIMSRLTGRGIRFVVDAEGESLRRTLKHQPFLIKPNQTELAALCRSVPRTRKEIAEAAGQLKEQGAENVLVSLAGEGAVLLDAEGRLHDRRAARGRAVNSVGAGDSMVAGFLAGILECGDYEYALRLGMSAGSASAFSDGLATYGQVKKLMEEGYAGI